MGSISTVTDGVDAVTAQRINLIAEALTLILGITDDAQSGMRMPVGRSLQIVDALTALWQDNENGDLKFRDTLAQANLADLGILAMPAPLYLGQEYHSLQSQTAGGSAAVTANRLYLWPQYAPVDLTVVGGRLGIASPAGNVLVGLYSDGSTLTKVAGSASTPLSAERDLSVYFTSNYSATKGLYWLAFLFDSSTAGIHGYEAYNYAKEYDAGSFALPASFSKPAGWSVPFGPAPVVPGGIGLVGGGIF